MKLVHNSCVTDDEHRSLQRSQYILLCSLQICCVVYKMEFLMLHPTVSSKSISYLGKWCATYPGAHARKSRDIFGTSFSFICQYIPCWSCLPDTPWLMPLFCTSVACLPRFPKQTSIISWANAAAPQDQSSHTDGLSLPCSWPSVVLGMSKRPCSDLDGIAPLPSLTLTSLDWARPSLP